MSLETALSTLKQNSLKLSGLNAKVQFRFSDDQALFVDATVSPPTVQVSTGEAVDCTFKMTIENFEKMVSGDLDPILAFTLGKVKVDGSMGVAMKLSSMIGD